ncbi:precorrin-3B C(17)-methyltransferase [Fusobacterium sp. IOR10]|uniref:precorrin-3B C(17)-methyltransferase n=1 Tax=Fusobacterium sp. IOR10 TaxID=2665157 RepID=UPI001EF12C8E|nr:precorrin-3B C(17)-methyltransferase [Fusobacterium sp. IOR10]
MTFRAYNSMEKSDVIIGHKTYVSLVEKIFENKIFIKSFMKKEIERCEETLRLAREGQIVSLISSGDAGVYGMAGIMLEIASGSGIEVEVVPGVTAATASASLVGAPIMHDSVTISLSDLLTDWELIKKRIELASKGDFVISLYNPKSKSRTKQIEEAREIMMKYKDSKIPVLIARNVGRIGENYEITDIENMLNCEINMFSTVIVGNSKTFVKDGKMITPRGYKVD